jgi:hypothetical protein
VGCLAASVQASLGFSLIGPFNEAYQVATIGYNLPGDIGAPKNLGEEYRRNMPVLYYAADANFWDYFGTNGVSAIDEAFTVFNNLTNVSKYSGDLSEFPFNTTRNNGRAGALFLIDVKSWAMKLIIEQLGLAEPVRYVWTLHDRFLPPGGTCPFNEEYLIIKRNFDPALGTSIDQLKPTSYVNGVLFSYEIVEICTGPNPLGVTLPFAVDPVATADSVGTPVAELSFSSFVASLYGNFYTGLTRDDVGGLRYLMRTNNVNFESAGPNTLAHLTNATPTLLVTSNLTLLATQALTNDAPTLQALYPTLNILSTSNFFVNVNVTNFSPYFTNFPWDPVGSPAHLAFVTNITTFVATRYVHTVGNVITFTFGPNGWREQPLGVIPPPRISVPVTIETASVAASNNPYAPVGTTVITTNVTDVTFRTNDFGGEYFILTTNLCEVSIIRAQLTNVLTFTNVLFTLTNTITPTNGQGFTNAGTVLSYTQSEITYFTNHSFIVFPIFCNPTNVSAYQGVEKIVFVRRDFDSLFGRFFNPITNEYVLKSVTNFSVLPQRIERAVTFPDFLITATDLSAGPDAVPGLGGPLVARTISYNTNSENGGLAGPGTIEPGAVFTGSVFGGTVFTFNKVGPIFFNTGLIDTNAFLDETTEIPGFVWGSFNGTTNTPALYPNDLSIEGLENQMLIQVNPQYLRNGVIGVFYSTHLNTVGSTPNWKGPFSWSLAPGSQALPPGLSITTGSNSTGLISGTPTKAGFYDFVIRVTDSLGRVVDRGYSLKVTLTP